MVLGDSLSSGYGIDQDAGWVNLLKERLRRERYNYTVANVSTSGETTLGGKNRIEAALRLHRPSIVIVALGANDGLRGAKPETMRLNLEAIVRVSRSHGARVLLLGMRLPPNYGKPYTEKFHAVFGEIARRQRVPLVPFLLEAFAENRDYFQADGLHPTAAAQPLILETVWKKLAPMLKR